MIEPVKGTKTNLVALYKNTALKNLSDAIYSPLPFLTNGIKVRQEGDDAYLVIYQDVTSSSVILNVYDCNDNLIVQERAVFNTETLEWEPEPIKN